ncbi:hypothetical protein P43SY_011815 [Pythium insidiosum]|uniref:Tf2-1-like SH3-like domain-containing protein n=1 Tax=Pythium insidiosum TaxID=114742 RepID=A0AAD5L694_PYTIN|nr:hypothetical protein P43SY_011815 [Pythium insidiosum]
MAVNTAGRPAVDGEDPPLGELGEYGDSAALPADDAMRDVSMDTDDVADDDDAMDTPDSPSESMDVNMRVARMSEDPKLTQWEASLLAMLATSDASDVRFNFEVMPDLMKLTPQEEKSINDFVSRREAVLRFVRDAVAEAVDKQKENADRHRRNNKEKYSVGDRVLLSTQDLPATAVSNLGSTKLLPRFIGPFTVKAAVGDAYTLDIPTRMRLHPTFYVGRLKRYVAQEEEDFEDASDREGHPRDSPREDLPAENRRLRRREPATTEY